MRIFWGFVRIGIALAMAVACTNVKLQASKGLIGSVNGQAFATIKPPEAVASQLRVLFFVDQSYSMIHGKCPSDIDGSAPRASSVGCANPAPGIDPAADRYTAIKAWISELTAASPNSKVALFPFSGGMNERPRKYPYSTTPIGDGFEHYRFLTLPQANTRVGDLLTEQETDIKKDTVIDDGNFVGSSPTYMGTTVPLSTLQFARDKIFDEMESLQKDGQLFNTRFRFVYLSDGVFKPTEELLDKALQLNNGRCAKKCVQDPRVVRCDGGWATVNGKGWDSLTAEEKAKWPAECGYPASNGYIDSCFCMNIGNDLYQSFGDPSDNKIERILSVLEEIKALPKYFGEGSLRMDFVRLHPERIQADDEQDIFATMQKNHGDSDMSVLVDGKPPFAIVGATPNQLTYQLQAFYVVNLNGLVNDMGEMVSDSDGDGLSDAAEVATGTDPGDPRTPDKDGKRWCLDSIEKKYGCKKTSCNPDLDSDGDGLNECEELTLQTGTFRKDNGSDGILDMLKAIKGFSLGADLRVADSNGDNTSDFDAFRMGLHPLVRATSIAEANKVRVRVKFDKYVPGRDGEGRTVQMGQYQIFVDQVPLVGTMATHAGSEVYRSKVKTPQSRIPPELLVGSTAHGKNINELLLIAKVQALQDPNKSYYLISRRAVQASVNAFNLQVNFGSFRQMAGN